MCKYCEPNKDGNMELLCDEPDSLAFLEDYGDGLELAVSMTTMFCGRECRMVAYVSVNHCPMCGRELRDKAVQNG